MKAPPDPPSETTSAASGGALSVPDWARRLSVLLDGAIQIPGTRFRIGLDPILGLLLPELGDALAAVISLALLGVAFRERVPKVVVLRMLLNIALDAVLGAIPLVGDAFDFVFKSNQKNLALIERYRGDPTRPARLGDYLSVGIAGLLALAVLLLPVLAGVALIRALIHPR